MKPYSYSVHCVNAVGLHLLMNEMRAPLLGMPWGARASQVLPVGLIKG